MSSVVAVRLFGSDVARAEQGDLEGVCLDPAGEDVAGASQRDGFDLWESHVELDRLGGVEADAHVLILYADLQGGALNEVSK